MADESSNIFSEAIIIGRRGGGGSGGKNCLVYGDTDGEAGKFDKLTVMPTTEGNPLRYNGEFRANKVFGVYYSDDADLAENYYIDGEIDNGDLVMVDEDGVIRRNNIYMNNKVLGFVSEKPGMVLGGKDNGLPIALNGRIYVNVENDCKPGDYLVAGRKAGYVMAVDSCDIGGIGRGCIVGMVLSSKNGIDDKVLTFVVRM